MGTNMSDLVAVSAGGAPSAVNAAKLPPDTFDAYEDELRVFKMQHGARFKDSEDCELFFMLPLSRKQRLEVMSNSEKYLSNSDKK